LAARIAAAKLEPADLLGMPAADIEAKVRVGPEMAARLHRLLAREGQVALELERLDRLGIWVLTTASDQYSSLLRERLGDSSPPVLFGLGERSLLDRDGLAVVGSRDADPESLEFARELGRQAARQGWALVSGAARGIDTEAMRGAFEAGGAVVGVAPEGVERYLRDVSLRAAFMDGGATCLSPYRPDAPFSVGAAMGRNRLIYCLARAAIVVNSAAGSGGTWAGALEAIGKGWVPIHVRDADPGSGNAALIAKGGLPLSALPQDLEHLARDGEPTTVAAPDAPELVQQTLF
jgi:predicted Rossmann fold nucleotide-binding protein DprA/Smf involved in DNA uptake